MAEKQCPVNESVVTLSQALHAGELRVPRDRRIVEELLQLLRDIAAEYLDDPDLWPEILESSGLEITPAIAPRVAVTYSTAIGGLDAVLAATAAGDRPRLTSCCSASGGASLESCFSLSLASRHRVRV